MIHARHVRETGNARPSRQRRRLLAWPSHWSTRRRLITTITIVFTALTMVVSLATLLIVTRQLETVIVNHEAPRSDDSAQQRPMGSGAPRHGSADDTAPPDDEYVSAGVNDDTDTLTLTAAIGNNRVRNMLLAVTLAPIAVFGVLSGAVTWTVSTHAQHRVNDVARQIQESGQSFPRRSIVIPHGHDEASTIADAYNGMLDDLNTALMRERRFIANASHELKNPLAATAAALQIPLHHGMVDERCRPFIAKALISNQTGADIVARLLDLARVQQLDHADLATVDLASIARTVVEEQRDAGGDTVTIHERYDQTLIPADPLLIRQLASNLMLNAMQHNHVAHPQVWVRVASGHALATAADHDGDGSRHACAMLEVSNTGADLTDVNLDELCTPFSRGIDSRLEAASPKHRATQPGQDDHGPKPHDVRNPSVNHGLGLAIVREIVALHHGTLHLQARHGGGMTVRVTLPCETPSSSRRPG